jgi:SAM-dependent methyltransferase
MSNWKSNKEEHLKLSAAAAEKYDELYEQANFATGSYMRYELDTIKRFISQVPSRNIVLDLGCGTGRDSFYLSKQFDKVYGYDFSPEMVFVANKNKLIKRAGNVSFEVKDIEEEELPWANGTIPLVNTAFGMGSFVENLENLFREVKRVLQPSGIAIFSFYNLDALVNKLDLQWKPALAARVVEGGSY